MEHREQDHQEWVLNGDTVLYALDSLKATLEYDFNQEKAFSYAGLSLSDSIRHLTGFISGVWQIHPFGGGQHPDYRRVCHQVSAILGL